MWSLLIILQKGFRNEGELRVIRVLFQVNNNLVQAWLFNLLGPFVGMDELEETLWLLAEWRFIISEDLADEN